MIHVPPIAAMLASAAALAAPTPAGPLQITSEILVERRVAAADGTTATRLVPAGRAAPGDRLTVRVAYRNTGSGAIANLAIVNPVPAGLAFRGASPGTPVPEVSVDGVRFGPLAALTVAGRPATAADVTKVRWRVASPVAPGSGGQFTFQAVLK